MKKKYFTQERVSIYKAKTDQTIRLSLWNETDEPVEQLYVSCNGVLYNNNNVMGQGSPQKDADTLHLIEMKAGDEIIVSAGKEKAVSFTIEAV